jgi:dCTP deaminase
MTILVDKDIKSCLDNVASGLSIRPRPADVAYQPASVDLRLGNSWAAPRLKNDGYVSIDNLDRRDLQYNKFETSEWLLFPGCFVLGCTIEVVAVPNTLAARVEGKSTLARMGLLVHATAGFIDPGFAGQITLELFNAASYPIKLVAGAYICQLCFSTLSGHPERLYGNPTLGSHYMGQQGATGAR